MLPTKFRFIWPSGFRGENLKNQPIRNKSGLWRPCLLMDRDEMSNVYRRPPIDAFYQISVHFAKRFQRRRFLEIDQLEKNCRWQPCLLANRNEMRNLYRGPPIKASYQVSVHLAGRFQSRSFFYLLFFF